MRTRSLLVSLALLAGCSQGEPSSPDGSATQGEVPTTPDGPDDGVPTPVENDSPTVSLEVKSAEDVDEIIASYAGRFVVVDLWALW